MQAICKNKIDEPLLEGGGSVNESRMTNQMADESDVSSIDENSKLSAYEKHITELITVRLNDRENAFIVNGEALLFSKTSTLYGMDNTSKVRYWIVWLVSQKWFDGFILLLIFINSILMGMKDYLDKDNLTPTNRMVEALDPYFNSIIVSECLLKILGMGFIMGKNAYLTDGWNWLDFSVVCSTVSQMLVIYFYPETKESAFAAFRAVRLLRPLRILGRV
jgi:hypothetical protein